MGLVRGDMGKEENGCECQFTATGERDERRCQGVFGRLKVRVGAGGGVVRARGCVSGRRRSVGLAEVCGRLAACQ